MCYNRVKRTIIIINITILFLNATRWFEMGGVGGGKFKGEQKCKFGFMYVLIIMLSLYFLINGMHVFHCAI